MKYPTRCMLLALGSLTAANAAVAQTDPLDYLTLTPITDNNPATNELGRDRVSINSTPFKNESMWTVGDYQFAAAYREDGNLMVMRRDLGAAVNQWDIVVTQFTSYNIDDAHNVPVIGIDGDGYLHLAWGTHANPLLYTRSTTPVTAGQPITMVGQAAGNGAAINTMTGTNESGTTYPNFIAIPGSGDLLFNYRTGGSGNGTYRIARFNNTTDNWAWADQTWIKNTDSSGLTYNAYPHNLSYDPNGGLHATWTYRYNSSSPTGNSGFQTNHNLHYAFSPDDGVTWYKDFNATVPYPTDIDESNSQVIVNIPEGSSLINTGTQAVDAHGRPAIATWWAPGANDPTPDHTRQYMYVGHDGNDWFTTQITQRNDEGFSGPIPEGSLGSYRMGRPQILFDDYNRAFVLYNDYQTGGGITVAYSQADSRDDWAFIQLTTDNLGNGELTVDRALWQATGQLHIFTQPIDGNSNNGGSPMQIVEWDAAAAMGRVLYWTAANSSVWDGAAVNFSDLGSPSDFDDFDNAIFDDTAGSETVQLTGALQARQVTVDTASAYVFTGPGALTAGSLSVTGGGSLKLANDGNSYAGPTRVANATLTITGNATQLAGDMIVADGGTLVMDSSDASTMTSAFEVWSTGTLQIGTPSSTTNVFPDGPVSITNNGLIRVYTDESLAGVAGSGSIEVAGGTTTLSNNAGLLGGVLVKPGATAQAMDSGGLGAVLGVVQVEAGGAVQLGASTTYAQSLSLAGDGGGAGALRVGPAVDAQWSGVVTVGSASTAIDVAAGSSATLSQAVAGSGGLTKRGAGTLRLAGNNSYSGATVVSAGTLILDQNTGLGLTIVEGGGTLEAVGTVRNSLTVLGGGTVRINHTAGTPSASLFTDDFSGTSGALNGTTPDVSTSGASWVAASAFSANGVIGDSTGGSATLAFTPSNGSVYTLDASFVGLAENASASNPEQDWLALGFVNGQSAGTGSNDRFVAGNVNGIAWMLVRGSETVTTNNTAFLGLPDSGTQNNTGGVAWANWSDGAGGDIDLRVVLDTTAGTGAWTATWYAKRPTDGVYTEVRATELLDSEAIDAIGIARSNTGFDATVTGFSLTTDSPPQGPQSGRTLTVQGNAFFNAGSTLELALFNPAGHDVLDVLGTLHADGTLAVTMDQGAPAPQLADAFDLLDFTGVSGAFDLLDLPTLGTGLAWDTSALYTTGTIVVIAFTPTPGDTDGDGDIDDADLGTSFSNYTGPGGTGKTAAQGDTDGDGDVDDGDLGVSFSNYTGPLGPAASANVPEPAGLALVALGLGVFGRRRRAR